MYSKSTCPAASLTTRAVSVVAACVATMIFLFGTDVAISSAKAATANDTRATVPTVNNQSQGAAAVQLWHAAARDAIARLQPNQQAALRLLAYLDSNRPEADLCPRFPVRSKADLQTG